MKNTLRSVAIAFFFFISFSTTAQENGSFTFQILNSVGAPIQKARLIVLSGESHMASPEGMITYFGEEDYIKKNGVYVKTRVMPHYITAKAPGYKDRKIDLTQYAIGAYIVIKLDKLDKLSSEYKSIDVFVKDENGKPLSGASVLVNPGQSTATDANGYAKAMHTILLSGEWVAIEVHKEGYKIQRQHIPSGDAPRMENGKQVPPATAYFTLKKGGNKTTIYHINVEVLDNESNDPVPGANVILELSDGDTRTGTTNSKGEFRFSDEEFSFSGLTAKIKVSKQDYEEKWSDITGELTEGVDNTERQFLVYIKKKEGDWSGTWEGRSSWGIHTIIFSGSGNSVSGTTTHAKSNGYTDMGQISGCKAEGNKLKCQWTEQYKDGDKSISRKGTVEIIRSGNSISGTALEDEPSFSWKPGITPYSSSMRKGAVWNWTVTKKN